jgi:hypothetical protein
MKNQEERWEKYSDSVELMKVRLRLIEKDEHLRWTRLVDRHHYLSSRLVGHQLRYVAELDGEWMALLSVGEASTHLEDRDRHIGWDNLQRGRRLRLIGQNTRFVILFDKAQQPNLASRILGLLHRRVSEDWLSRYGHPLVALETFVDPAYFRGTCYKASGWMALGRTKGYGRVRRDYYQPHGRPKELWFKTLHPAGVRGLRRRRLPLRYRKYEIDYRPCPLGTPAIKALFDTFEHVLDPRKRKGRRYPLKTLLTILALGTVCGIKGIRGMASFADKLTQMQRKALRCPFDKNTGQYDAPGETCLRDLLVAIQPAEVERALAVWMQGLDESELRCIAIDGKTVKGTAQRDEEGHKTGSLHLVMACTHEHARLLAQEPIDVKENEIVAVKRLLLNMPFLEGAVVTGDAMNTQPEIARLIVQEKGGSTTFA